jgi:hypothetical protein
MTVLASSSIDGFSWLAVCMEFLENLVVIVELIIFLMKRGAKWNYNSENNYFLSSFGRSQVI